MTTTVTSATAGNNCPARQYRHGCTTTVTVVNVPG